MKTKDLNKMIDRVSKAVDDEKAVEILMDSLHGYMWDDRKDQYNENRLNEVKSMTLELLTELRDKRVYNNKLKWRYKGVAVMRDGSSLREKTTSYDGESINEFKKEFINDIEKCCNKSDVERMEITKVYY